ncbi:MAG: hypothetical protein GW938_15890 [Leptospira sp.]|nr:hypothetical protein [Leptospira sp.]NCS93702.1 hypothetical protein [Leptospira sp.]
MGFSIHEIGQINDRLIHLKSHNQQSNELSSNSNTSTSVGTVQTVYIDNLHSAYLELGDFFNLPSCSSMNGPDYHSVQEYLDQVLPLAPKLFEGLHLLPEPRPKKEIGKIIFVKEMPSVGNQKFLLVLSIDFFYLGGAKACEVIQKSTQELTSSIKASRIYFKISIVPVEEIITKRNRIVGFNTFEMKELLNWKQTNEGSSTRILPITVMFDDIDFQEQEKLLQKVLNINDSIWKLGKIYTTTGMDFLSFSLRFLTPDISLIEEQWAEFGSSVWNRISSLENYIDGKSEDKDIQEFHRFLEKHEVESQMSASGNLRWKIDFVS